MMDEKANDPRDLAKKVREDPMFLIKKKEQEAIRDLKSNPVRMKQLREVRWQRERERGRNAERCRKG